MTTIPLSAKAVRAYIGNRSFRCCQDISKIICRPVNGENGSATVRVEARIPASSTRQGSYEISVCVCRDGSMVQGGSCSCPIGYKCKHIHKVLWRIAERPIPGPGPEELAREARRRQYAERMERASVYIAIACKSELDSGSDFRRSFFVKDNIDREILCVFFSKKEANLCAREYIGMDEEKDYDDDDDEDDDDDDVESFVYDGSDEGDYDEEQMFQKVWVERRAIEDASSRFHK